MYICRIRTFGIRTPKVQAKIEGTMTDGESPEPTLWAKICKT